MPTTIMRITRLSAVLPVALSGARARALSIAVTTALTALAPLATAPTPAAAQSRFESMDVFQLEYAADPQITFAGDRIVYVRTSMDIMTDRKRSELWVVNLDGTGHRRLAAGSSPRWTRDGRRLAYIADGQIQVRWMDTGETSTLTQLTESPSGIRWSPDGRST